MRTPGTLEHEIKLENAIPLAGFVTRPAQLNQEAHPDDYIRSGKLRVIPAEVDRVIEIITAEIPLFQSSESGILSFVAVQSLEEFDTIILWERYVSRAAFDLFSQKDGLYSALMKKIKDMVEAEEMTEYAVAGGYLSNT